jgi:hypothetical protein
MRIPAKRVNKMVVAFASTNIKIGDRKHSSVQHLVNTASEKIPQCTIPKLLDGFHHGQAIEGTTQCQEQSKALLTLRNAGRNANLLTGLLTGADSDRYVSVGAAFAPASLPLHDPERGGKGGRRGEGLHATAVRDTRKWGGERNVPIAVEEREVWVGGGTTTVLGFRGSDGAMCGGSPGRARRSQTTTILDDPSPILRWSALRSPLVTRIPRNLQYWTTRIPDGDDSCSGYPRIVGASMGERQRVEDDEPRARGLGRANDADPTKPAVRDDADPRRRFLQSASHRLEGGRGVDGGAAARRGRRAAGAGIGEGEGPAETRWDRDDGERRARCGEKTGGRAVQGAGRGGRGGGGWKKSQTMFLSLLHSF